MRSEKMETSFKDSIKAISKIFCKYSILDVATSLFISDMWLPNIASSVKRQLLIIIFASLKPGEFSAVDSITSYHHFRSFLEAIYGLLPSFPMIEDYIPELDWGEVKFHHERRNYRIFYGSEIEDIYDFLVAFQILHCSFEGKYVEHTGRSPKEELRYCLQLQDRIISGITSQAKAEESLDISFGHLEVPSLSFWKDASNFYKSGTVTQNIDSSFLERFSIVIGKARSELHDREAFEANMYYGIPLPTFFIKHNDLYLPVLPRRYSEILFSAWGEIFNEHREKLVESDKDYLARIGADIYQYIKARVETQKVFPFVSALNEDGTPHEVVFSSAIIPGNRLVLSCLLPPAISGRQIQDSISHIAPKLGKAMALIKTPPVRLALHADRKNIEFHPDSNDDPLQPVLLIIVPEISMRRQPIALPNSLPGYLLSLDQFLGIVDELDSVDLIASFVDYLEQYDDRMGTIPRLIDKFGSFRDSYGILAGGAIDFDHISIDPHWGSNMRYESLANFWNKYPEIDPFGHPRSWRVTKETKSRTRLEARGYLGCLLHCRVGNAHVFLTAPFEGMSFEQAEMANLLMECLEDSMSRHEKTLEKHRIFSIYSKIQINFFPHSFIQSSDRFQHLSHLDLDGKHWCLDYGSVEQGVPGIRIVFDDVALRQAFVGVKDASLETELLLEVINQLNAILPDSNIGSVQSALEKAKAGPARFGMFYVSKIASFPEFIQVHEPTLGHYKQARKRVAELAKQCGLLPGAYELEDAKKKLNRLRRSVVSEIDLAVSQYSYGHAIPYLISRIDALSHKYERGRLIIERSTEHEVDYDRGEMFAEKYESFVRMHRDYRYLIEKFVQLQPQGTATLQREQFQYLVALANWLHVIYHASDNLHYGIDPVGMAVDGQYIIEMQYADETKSKAETYMKEQANLRLGLLGNPNDKVESPKSTEELIREFDEAFYQDLGFSLSGTISFLHLLSGWPTYKHDMEESPHYSASREEIKEICTKNIEGIEAEEIDRILDFLTLNSHDVIRLLDQEGVCDDIPVWEHRKRYARYNLRPLIPVAGKYYWGSYSSMKSGMMWADSVLSCRLPTDLRCTAIQNLIDSENEIVQGLLEDKAFEIIQKYTAHVRKNAKLHRLDKQSKHPPDLGDYDVLGFYPEKNYILSVECKDILPAHCFKDLKRLREKFFGRSQKDKGYIGQVSKRHDYLLSNLPKIATILGWPIDISRLPSVISIVVSRRDYWWTRFPPREVDVEFLRIDSLSDFLDTLAV